MISQRIARSIFLFSTIIFLILGHQGATANGDATKGYIVTNDGDTIVAVIKAKKWDLSPQKIVAIVNGDEKRYVPFDIRSFTAGGRTFISAHVKKDASNHLAGTLDFDDPAPRWIDENVFAELLIGGSKIITVNKENVTGSKLLYRYKDPAYKLHFYISEKYENLEPLIFKQYTKNKRDGFNRIVVVNEEYKRQLNKFLSSCEEISKYVNVTSYEQGQMVSLFLKYYQCSK